MGEILQDMEKAKGGEQYHKTTGPRGLPVVPTYADLSITKKEAARWQKIAEVDEKIFEQVIGATRLESID